MECYICKNSLFAGLLVDRRGLAGISVRPTTAGRVEGAYGCF